MKTRGRTDNSRAPLSNNEGHDMHPSTSSVEPLTTTSSVVEPLTTASSVVEPLTTPTLKSEVWMHFERCVNIIPLKAKCLLCQEKLLTPNSGTSSLKRHLVQRHGLQQFRSTEAPRSLTIPVKLSKPEKQKLDSLAVNAIIQDARVYGDMQKPGMRKFINALKPGYKPPTRNVVVKRLKHLHQQHTFQTKSKFQEAKFLSITCDFWKNRTQDSFLVLTGHYLDDKFDQHSKILKFMCFQDRHYSPIIAQEIEKQLIDLNLYDKLVTITCDGAPNMRDMFTYFTRRNIQFIHCIAHKLHLIICNSLDLWVTRKKKQTTTNNEEAVEDIVDEEDEDDNQLALSQMVRTMSFDVNDSWNNNDNNQNPDISTEDNDMGDEFESNDEMNDFTSDEDEWIDENDDDGGTTDNFSEGVNIEETFLDNLQQKTRDVIDKAREIVKTIKYSSVLSAFINKQRLNYNLKVNKEKRIKRRLANDVQTRWNSTYKMLHTVNLYRDLINNLFQAKGSLGLRATQRRKLTCIELSTDEWDLLKLLINLLEPFYSATKVLSNTKYPTIGSAFYIMKTLEQYLETEENDEILSGLKMKMLMKFHHYMFDDVDQFKTLKLYSYFDPIGFSALTKAEQASVEKEIVKIYKKEFETKSSSSSSSSSPENQQTITTTKPTNIDKAWQGFLKSTNKDLRQEVSTTATINDDIKRYRNLATKFPTIFWKEYGLDLPILSTMARCYLSAPATSVQSESAFSVSAHYGRKERSRLSADNLAMSVFLKDKL